MKWIPPVPSARREYAKRWATGAPYQNGGEVNMYEQLTDKFHRFEVLLEQGKNAEAVELRRELVAEVDAAILAEGAKDESLKESEKRVRWLTLVGQLKDLVLKCIDSLDPKRQ